ncbi:MAG: hypothetical protein M3144_07615 [Actinomycetota bacterium]|nr:hypothetical protein [Actinomycetota bacterium]
MLAACGGEGGDDNSKAAWEEEHGDLVDAYSRDLSDALNTINQGERARTTGSCTQVSDDGKELREKVLPVPNAAVDAPLRKAVDLGITAAEHCLQGARAAEHGAEDIETAQREFGEARTAMDEAEAAIDAWT